ncbi:hypothetical protein ACH4SK_33375 [Streptomyces inhibens]|uniref:hypothetical protein n=1 Tax=Streptomyces inhibens TaxID=2293571 RepID=UPI0037AFADC5
MFSVHIGGACGNVADKFGGYSSGAQRTEFFHSPTDLGTFLQQVPIFEDYDRWRIGVRSTVMWHRLSAAAVSRSPGTGS